MDAPQRETVLALPLAWAPDARWIAFSRGGSEIEIEIEIESGQPPSGSGRIATLDADGEVSSLSVSRDGEWLACGCLDGTVVVWKVDLERRIDWVAAAHGRIGETAAGPTEATPTLVAFSPVDDSLAVARGAEVLLLRGDAAALDAAAAPASEEAPACPSRPSGAI